ncbi:hypothetical protein BOX15_Mlig030305g1 [Macrostomum lignano]|uniref:PCIF1 WW domain-containing protein n=1 Tax=Macrostomum lignano TaxID=282301 RepID=A0A267DHV6_9PLAT|nr:hypothetical protein BOX15_Mlig030305g1 [Macrostomum lignano]
MADEEQNLHLKLLLEYSQFREIDRLASWLEKRTQRFQPALHRYQQKRTENQFGRWLITMQTTDGQQMSETFPLLPQKLNDNGSKDEFVKSLCLSFSDMSSDEATHLVESLLSMIDQFLQGESDIAKEDKTPKLRYEEAGSRGRITFGKFRTPRSKRVKQLVELCGEQRAALVCLRYHSLSMFRGGESSLCPKAFDALFELGKAAHEGFASPLNCQLLGRQGAKFCSLFPDTDSPFGSLGDFFRIDLMQHPGGWVLNPPFEEILLRATARRVVDILDESERGAFWFFLTVPDWTDCDGWQILDESEWKVDRIDVEPNQLGFQDCYGSPFTTQVKVSLFAMGEPPAPVNFAKLWDAMRMDAGE